MFQLLLEQRRLIVVHLNQHKHHQIESFESLILLYQILYLLFFVRSKIKPNVEKKVSIFHSQTPLWVTLFRRRFILLNAQDVT